MHKLVLGQLVASTSGNNGGMQLARSAAAITIADVVVAIEGPVHTFPDRGYFDQVFNDVEPVADAGTQVVNDIFAQADQRWLAFLAQQKLATLIKELLAVPQIPVLDWNNQTEDKYYRKCSCNKQSYFKITACHIGNTADHCRTYGCT